MLPLSTSAATSMLGSIFAGPIADPPVGRAGGVLVAASPDHREDVGLHLGHLGDPGYPVVIGVGDAGCG